VKPPAVRSQLLRLRDELRAAADGRELLDRKREAILRALGEAIARRDRLHRDAVDRLGAARAALAIAQLEIGRAAVAAAALAQPPLENVEVTETSIVGVRVPVVRVVLDAFHARYGPASGSPSLDAAGSAFVASIGPIAALAAADTAVRRLRAALARTARRLNALDREVIPAITGEIRTLSAALEEEERDDAVRRKRRQPSCTG
jgi:V/A-type H+/Na+-transporting ATPase subunit D